MVLLPAELNPVNQIVSAIKSYRNPSAPGSPW
jgi:hypothetical protein